MKILHVGGYPFLTQTLAQLQAQEGHQVRVLGCGSSLEDPDLPAFEAVTSLPELISTVQDNSTFDIVQFHRLASLLDPQEQKSMQLLSHCLGSLRERGSRVFYYSYGKDPLAQSSTSSRTDILFPQEFIREHFCHLFIGQPESDVLSPRFKSSSWLPAGLRISDFPRPEVYEPKSQEVRVLHISHAAEPGETAFLLDTVEQLKSKGLKFNFKHVLPEATPTFQSLKDCINDCDMYVEQCVSESYGPLAILALALGKTVISGNNPRLRDRWNQLSICSVLDTNQQNLARRIDSIVREPRCLRDLNVRSRKYAESAHDAETACKLSLAQYAKAL